MADKKEGAGEKVGQGLGCLFILVLVVALLGSLRDHIWGEREGFTKTDDCRNTVIVKEGSFDTWFKKFTCTEIRTKSGRIIKGTCVAVDTEGPVCQTVYTYDKKPQIVCSDPKFPYAGFDDMCHVDPQ